MQESYVLTMTKEKRNGVYVEIGSGDPQKGSNTWLLETEYGWTGLAIDINKELADKYNKERSNPCIAADALTFDYLQYFKKNDFPKTIDYLQIDIDGHDRGLCLLALLALPMLQYRFKVITIEHDLCVDFKRQAMRDAQREILHALGYRLTGQLDGEDWWIGVDELEIPIEEHINTYLRDPYVEEQVP